MTLTIQGVDVTQFLASVPELTIRRTLNKPSTCVFAVTGNAEQTVRGNAVAVAADNGTLLFSGFIAADPFQECVGDGGEGAVYVTRVLAASDEIVLDSQALPAVQSGVAEGAGKILGDLTGRLASRGLDLSALTGGPEIGIYSPSSGARWSVHAGEIAAASRQAYRALNSAVSMQPAGSVTHTLSAAVAEPGTLECDSARTLASDVTLTGAMEPDLYALELFEGDGVTTDFTLTRSPMRAARPVIVDDCFTSTAINGQVWSVTDSGAHFGIGPSGLSVTGGTGADGQTTLAMIDPVELGGSLVFEAGGVSFAAGSVGQVCGLYSGLISLESCIAGFRLLGSEGAMLLACVVEGEDVGTPFTLTPSHSYTIRIRLQMPEIVRALATYYSDAGSGVLARGGGVTPSQAWVQFELQDSAAAVNTPATVLYEGSIAIVPVSATFCAVDSINVVGFVGYCSAQRGEAARVSIVSGGVERTVRVGLAAQGAECHMTGEKLHFYTAATPAAGSIVKVRYRSQSRSVARLAATTNAAAGLTGIPADVCWAGSVRAPEARCSADCESAAQALLDFSTRSLAAWGGTISAANLQDLSTGDVWPGDDVVLATPLVSGSMTQPASLTVRDVLLRLVPAVPEYFVYSLRLANDWAEDLSVKLSDAVAQDALLPAAPAPSANAVAPNVQGIDVPAISASQVTLSMNVNAPSGGGFEVRRQDANFGSGSGTVVAQEGLVVRSPVAIFSLPRAADHEEFFVRMYDGSTPPLYSRVSAAVITNNPVT